ncbi:MAG TPA: glycosyltransferase family 2 protein [Candidatus Paceibacterota bacterium]|nr:glycosyltransferase family 2 protein [Candidatus Paceibacterota bacterium]
MKLSIVVPFYNEEKNIPLVLQVFQKFASSYDFELICINDGSKDNTAEVFTQFAGNNSYPFAKFISYSPNGGYGNAIMTGVRAATGDIVGWTHSDMQTDPKDVFTAFDVLKNETNKRTLVKGARINRPLPQVVLSYGMAVIASVILRKVLVEINAQPKVFFKECIELLTNAPKDFSLDLYLLYQAKIHGYTIKTIDVEFKNRLHGESSWGGSFQNRIKTIKRTYAYIWKLAKSK